MKRQRYANSRKMFRKFLKQRGILGRRPPAEDDAQEDSKTSSNDPDSSNDPNGEKDTKKSHRSYILRYIRSLRQQRGRLALIIALMLFGQLLRSAMPLSPKIMMDYVLPRRDVSLLVACCGMLLAIGVSQIGLELIRDILTRTLTGNFVTQTKRRMMRHLQFMPLERLQELKVGGIVSRLQSDSESMAGLLFQGLLTPLNALVMFSIAAASLFYINWRVAIVCLAMSGLIILVSYVYFNFMRPYWKALREDIATLGAHATETFSGMPVVRAFCRERSEARLFSLETHLLWRKTLHGNVLSAGVHRSVWTVYWLINISIWFYGGYEFTRNRMTIGDLMAFIAFVEWFFQPIFMIMFSLTEMQNSLACAERVFDLLDEPLAMPDRPEAKVLQRIDEGIHFEGVSFDYPDGTRALTDVTFTIPQGKVTALVGPSGAGKTTITNLVMRFYDVTEGAVQVDGVDLRELRLGHYRRLLSLVLQEVFLFDGTVRENISYGMPEATQDTLEAAARVAHCHDFIAEFDKGYDTIIGERGVKLSGGQKQRVALARAILTDPQLLILDEATSNLDSESEHLIQDALRHIFAQRTTLVIAHRLSTIMDADKIVVLDKGAVVEQGRHDELLDRRGRYWELYTKQMEKAERSKQYFDWNLTDAPSSEDEASDTGHGEESP